MPFFLMKSILSTVLFAMALVAVFAMLTLMGKQKKSLSPNALRLLHRIFGWSSIVLIVVISYFCVKYVAAVGDEISTRAVMHGVLATALIGIVLLKLLIVKVYREFLRLVPTLGMTAFVFLFVVVATSAGFYFVRAWCVPRNPTNSAAETAQVDEARGAETPAGEGAPSFRGATTGAAERGASVYASNCLGCHPTEPGKDGIGPGLAGVMQSSTLPVSDRKATPANVRAQIFDPVGTMPSFEGRLTNEEIADVIAYMGRLEG